VRRCPNSTRAQRRCSSGLACCARSARRAVGATKAQGSQACHRFAPAQRRPHLQTSTPRSATLRAPAARWRQHVPGGIEIALSWRRFRFRLLTPPALERVVLGGAQSESSASTSPHDAGVAFESAVSRRRYGREPGRELRGVPRRSCRSRKHGGVPFTRQPIPAMRARRAPREPRALHRLARQCRRAPRWFDGAST
jgi:hypothetical protein